VTPREGEREGGGKEEEREGGGIASRCVCVSVCVVVHGKNA
jgi:hypothetical protein